MGEKKYYWIKLKTNFFNSEQIDFLMSQNEGSKYVVLYQMLCLNTANNDGELSSKIGEMIVPYNVEKIVRDTKYFNENDVIVSLELFKKLGLIYEEENQILKIANFDEMVGGETKWAEKKRIYREKQKQLQIGHSEDNVRQENRDKSIENRVIDIDLDIKKEEDKDIRTKVPYEKIKDLFHEICVSFPKVMKLNDTRKKAIKARYNEYNSDIEIFRELFTKAERSNFLKGNNDNNWSATFDWLLKPQNMIKVLEGNYENKQSTFTNTRKPVREEIVPEWFNKEQKKETMSAEDQAEVDELFKRFEEEGRPRSSFEERKKALEKKLKSKYGKKKNL